MLISVIIPTYNPSIKTLQMTLDGLKSQTLPVNQWELIIIDNNSTNQFQDSIDMSWHPNCKIIKEEKQGLTYARIRGFEEAKGELVLMVDDDNILNKNYLQIASDFMQKNLQVGSLGGKSIGYFDGFEPEAWTQAFWPMIAVRDLGDDVMISANELKSYPFCAPIGAGMVLRKDALTEYMQYIKNSGEVIKDRTGNSLASGGDNEINIFIIKAGFSVAYNPQLELKHIIPPNRLTKAYLARLNYESSQSWVALLRKYNLSPWQPITAWTVPIRKLKNYITYQAWQHPVNYIRWAGSCGIFEGLSS